MPRLKLITFDLDNTLWDVDRVIVRAERKMRAWLAERAPEFEAQFPADRMLQLRHEVVQANPALQTDLSKLREELLFQALNRCGYEQATARDLAADAFALFFEARHDVEFFAGALEILAHLSSEYTLAALTNGNADFTKLQLDQYFSFGLSSASVGAAKPAPQMFHAALERAGVQAHQCAHVGDHLVDDIEGADAVGMHTVWVNFTDVPLAAAAPAPSETVSELPQVIAAIERIDAALDPT